MPHMCSIGFRSGDILGHSITFNVSFISKAVSSCGVFGVVILLENCRSAQFMKEGIVLCFRMSQYMLESMFPSMNRSSQYQQYSCSPRQWCYHHHAWLFLGTPHQGVATHAGHPLSQTRPLTHQTTGHGSINSCSWPGCHQQTVCRLFCKPASEEASSETIQTDLLQCVVYGLSTDKLTFHFCNL